MNQKRNLAINRVISELMERVMDRVLITDPFIKEKHRANKPLYSALVPDEIFKGSHFERRFVTPFGGVWELVGGEGTYKNFIIEVNSLGREYKERIYREFLGIEPPLNSDEDVLR